MRRNQRIGCEKKWREHAHKAEEHPESVAAYCRETGISAGALGYWRKKIRDGENSARTSVVEDRSLSQSSFVPVEVVQESGRRFEGLPDPVWVAEVLRHLAGGVQ